VNGNKKSSSNVSLDDENYQTTSHISHSIMQHTNHSGLELACAELMGEMLNALGAVIFVKL